MIVPFVYMVVSVLCVVFPENPAPNDALMFILIANLWLIFGDKK